MEPAFRCGTRKAMDELAEELNLPEPGGFQDWPYEVVEPSDIDKYINYYHILTDDDKKFVLMEGIIQSTEKQPTLELVEQYWNIVKPLLHVDFKIHEYTIYYWASFDSEDLSDCWNVAPFMRELWNEQFE